MHEERIIVTAPIYLADWMGEPYGLLIDSSVLFGDPHIECFEGSYIRAWALEFVDRVMVVTYRPQNELKGGNKIAKFVVALGFDHDQADD